jgi:hypothetical protein
VATPAKMQSMTSRTMSVEPRFVKTVNTCEMSHLEVNMTQNMYLHFQKSVLEQFWGDVQSDIMTKSKHRTESTEVSMSGLNALVSSYPTRPDLIDSRIASRS